MAAFPESWNDQSNQNPNCIVEDEPDIQESTPVVKGRDLVAIKRAIERAFPYESGKLIIHEVGKVSIRANWHADDNHVSKSLFLKVIDTPDGMLVEDATKVASSKTAWSL
jgi:hypothetical protein